MVDEHRKEISDRGKGRPCEVRGKGSWFSPVTSEQGQGVCFISYLLSLSKSSAGVGMVGEKA